MLNRPVRHPVFKVLVSHNHSAQHVAFTWHSPLASSASIPYLQGTLASCGRQSCAPLSEVSAVPNHFLPHKSFGSGTCRTRSSKARPSKGHSHNRSHSENCKPARCALRDLALAACMMHVKVVMLDAS
jgi:hypothetical protein